MSSALNPLGMNSYNNRSPYKSSKGTDVFSNPTGSGRCPCSCCIFGSNTVVPTSTGTTILYITYPVSFSSISDAPVPVIQNEYILVVPSYELIDPNTNKVKMTLIYHLFTNNDAELLTVGLSFANNVNYYNQNTSIIEIIQFDGMPLYGLGNQFSGLTPEILISAPDQPRIINGTSALNCFKDCTNFNSPGIINWNIGNVVNMSGMFQSTTKFNQNISNWDVSKVTTMNSMFNGAILFNNGEPGIQPISGTAVSSYYTDATRTLTCPNGKLFLTDLSLNDGIVISTSAGVIYSSQIKLPIVSDVSLVLLTAYGFNLNTGITSIQKIPTSVGGNIPLSSWNTGNTQDMKQMFQYALSFNQYIGDWDTHSVREMSSMFVFASSFNNGQISGLSGASLNDWNTGSVENMTFMFQCATAFNQPIGDWDTHSVIDMGFMFMNTQFNQPLTTNINKWNTGSVENMTYMFQNTSAFNKDISSWNTGSVENMSNMFHKALAFNNGDSGNNGLNPLNSWNTGSVTNMKSMFHGVSTFNQEVSNWVLPNVTNVTSMFQSTTNFNNGDIGNNGLKPLTNWTTPNCIAFIGMFSAAMSFNQPISNLVDTTGIILDASGNGVNLTSVFQNATIFNQNLNTWNTSNVTNMNYVFNSASSFNNGDASGASTTPLTWITDNVTTMNSMFLNAQVFNQPINTSGNYWNTGKVTDMSQMLYSAIKFNQDISLWKTGSVINMGQMFRSATLFNQTINTDASGSWNVSKVIEMNSMFQGATAFNNGRPVGTNDTSLNWYAPNCTNFKSMFQSATAFNQPIPFLVDTSGIILDAAGNGVNLTSVFQSTTKFNQNIGSWNVSKATTLDLMFSSATAFNNGQLLPPNISGNVASASYASGTSILYVPGAAFNADLSLNDVLIITAGTPTTTTYYTSQIQRIISDASLVLLTPGSPINAGLITSIKKQVAGNSTFDLSWNTVNVTTMASMFNLAYYFNQNISNWNVSNVASMISMFAGSSTALKSTFNNGQLAGSSGQPLNWTASKCTIFTSMFAYTAGFNQPVPTLVDTSTLPSANSVMGNMFNSASVFNQNIGSWNTKNVTNMASTFFATTVFNNGQLLPPNISGNVTSASYTNATSILSVPGAAFNADLSLNDVLIITMATTYYTSQIQRIISDASLVLLTPGSSINAGLITSIKKQVAGNSTFDLSWNTTNVTTMASMFNLAYYFNQNISNWNVSNVASMTLMFAGGDLLAKSTFNNGQLAGSSGQPLNWTASKCTIFTSMFAYTAGFNQPVPTLVDTSTLPSANSSMVNMFNSASVFNQNVSTWNTTNVTNMTAVFQRASVFNNGQSVTQTVRGTPSLASYSSASPFTLTCPDASFNLDFLSGDGIIITTGGSAIYSSIVATIPSNATLTLSNTYPISISLAAGLITSIKKQVVGTADLSWNTQNVTNTSAIFNLATYFNQRLPWNMRLNRTVVSMFNGTAATFINLFNNGQIITGTTQPLYPAGENIWDFSGSIISSSSWHTNSRLTTANGLTNNPAITF